GGQQRERWLPMHPELARALAWWCDVRPARPANVFMQVQNDTATVEPFTKRLHFMRTLCALAGVKPFGFHAVRHTAASVVFVGGGLAAAQDLMSHQRATTTDIYVRAAGLYANQGAITDALGQSRIGQAAAGLLEKTMPQEMKAPEAFCTPDHVHDLVQ
ncbi:MAG: tyrosine-type recombinase/integrase, partial [Desulfobulbus sp.]|nr:tyrosine-type recombinase/integrase [Desulfobulbus sp.]